MCPELSHLPISEPRPVVGRVPCLDRYFMVCSLGSKLCDNLCAWGLLGNAFQSTFVEEWRRQHWTTNRVKNLVNSTGNSRVVMSLQSCPFSQSDCPALHPLLYQSLDVSCLQGHRVALCKFTRCLWLPVRGSPREGLRWEPSISTTPSSGRNGCFGLKCGDLGSTSQHTLHFISWPTWVYFLWLIRSGKSSSGILTVLCSWEIYKRKIRIRKNCYPLEGWGVNSQIATK